MKFASGFSTIYSRYSTLGSFRTMSALSCSIKFSCRTEGLMQRNTPPWPFESTTTGGPMNM